MEKDTPTLNEKNVIYMYLNKFHRIRNFNTIHADNKEHVPVQVAVPTRQVFYAYGLIVMKKTA